MSYPLIFFVVSMSLIGAAYLLAHIEKLKRREFLIGLLGVQDQLKVGKATVDGMTLTNETYMCTYEMCVSVLVVCVKLHSRYVTPGTPIAILLCSLFSLLTLCLGWWSFSGIVWTPQVLLGNLTNANRKRVITILEEATPPGVPSSDLILRKAEQDQTT